MSNPRAFEFIFFCEELFLHSNSNYIGKIHIRYQGNYSDETPSLLMKIMTCHCHFQLNYLYLIHLGDLPVCFAWEPRLTCAICNIFRKISGILFSHMKWSVSSTEIEMYGLAEVTAWISPVTLRTDTFHLPNISAEDHCITSWHRRPFLKDIHQGTNRRGIQMELHDFLSSWVYTGFVQIKEKTVV